MKDIEFADRLHDHTRASWRDYLTLLDPLRPGLHSYARRLTGDIWDAEDLVHDTLLRGFALLGSVSHRIEQPRAYLLRIATNLWIDRQRRLGREAALLAEHARAAEAEPATPEQAARVRDAGTALLQRLGPQERAAVLLKDVFESTLEESAEILGTTTGAVKAALHRARGKLAADTAPARRASPDPRVVDRFCAAFNARDREALLALLLDSAAIEMPGVDLEVGRAAFTREPGWLYYNLKGAPDAPELLKQNETRWLPAVHEGETLALVLTTIAGRERLGSVMRFETEDERVARIRVYAFCPDAVREVGESLGLPVLVSWYSFPAMVRGMTALAAGKA